MAGRAPGAPELSGYDGAQALVRRLTHQLGVALRGDAPPPAPVPGSEEDLPLPPWMVEMPFLSPLLVAYDTRIAQLEEAHAEAERRGAEGVGAAKELAIENDDLRRRLADALAAAALAAQGRHDAERADVGDANAEALVELEGRLALLAAENAMLRERAQTDSRMLDSAASEIEHTHAERRRAVDEAARTSRAVHAARAELALTSQRAEAADAELDARTAQLEDLHAELLATRAQVAQMASAHDAAEARVGEAQRALVLAQDAAAAREGHARAFATDANTAAEAIAVQLDDAQQEAAARAQLAESLRAELRAASERVQTLADELDDARAELLARAAREGREAETRARAHAELTAALAERDAALDHAKAQGAGSASEAARLRQLIADERARAAVAAEAVSAEANGKVRAAREELEALDRVVAELRAQLDLKRAGGGAAEAARAAASALRLASEEGAVIGSLREALAAAARRRDEADEEAAAALRRQRRVEAELDAERARARTALAAAEREADSCRRQAVDAARARDAESAKLLALQSSLSDPSAPTQRQIATLEASLRSQELQLQKAFQARDTAEAELRELRGLAASQAELAEQYASEARREQLRHRELVESLSADNDQLRVLLNRPRSAAHRDELLTARAAEVQRLRAELAQLQARTSDAERRADLASVDNTTAIAMIHRAQSLLAV